ncbi:hypothetical protein HA402_002675 [Bradysia odoriphaga]|nr:hypothetical protein HA402_002675 [Bradysia odoriphaga]
MHREKLSGNGTVTLQLSNLDTTYEQTSLKKFLIGKLQSIAPILSFTFEGVVAKICLPSMEDAKQVVSYLHRKKVGHKRICVSYTKDCSSLDPSTLKCQVAGLLKDIPNYRLSMYKFRELFQSRFKTSISVGNLCAMSDICTITDNANEKFVCLRPELSQLIERGELNDCLLQSVPYCSIHFKKGHRGWAEQEIEPLPNVWMSVADVRSVIFALTQKHSKNIPVASLIHCIQSELACNIVPNDKGVNFEHLLSCVNEIQITTNKFGIKVLNWVTDQSENKKLSDDTFNAKGQYAKNSSMSDAYGQFSNDVYELLQTCPKSTMKFARFIPTYHNTFNRQCRVADYGFVKLIDLFDAIPLTVQVLGEGENRLITLTHKRQMRRLAAELIKVLRTTNSKSIRLLNIPKILSSSQKHFEITDFGICYLKDAVEELSKNVAIISVEPLSNSDDMLISLPKKRAPNAEGRKTSQFAAETIELLKRSPQYTIAYEKFSCNYHYHFTYQLRLNDYGHTKLADMMECLQGIVKIEIFNDEDRKIYLCPKVAQRIFSEQLRDITEQITGNSFTFINVSKVLALHKKKFGYQIKPETLGSSDIWNGIKALPFVELIVQNEENYIICHHDDNNYKFKSHIIVLLLESMTTDLLGKKYVTLSHLINTYYEKYGEEMNDSFIESMNHLIDIQIENNAHVVSLSKLAVFLLSIINTLKLAPSMTVGELKTKINLKINLTNACFEIGYPDLKAIIESFGDMFVILSPDGTSEWGDRSEIALNKSSVFASEKHPNTDNNRSFKVPIKRSFQSTQNTTIPLSANRSDSQNGKSANSSFGSNPRIPLGEIGRTPSFQPCVRESYSEMPLKFMRTNNNEMIPNNSAVGLEKENINYYGNGVQSNTSPTNLKMRKKYSLKRTHDQLPASHLDDIEEIINNKISTQNLLSHYLAPPKPDTPVQSSIPFWLDPIWRNSPQASNEPLNIPIPELKTFPFQPKLDTPTMMARLSREGKFKFNA